MSRLIVASTGNLGPATEPCPRCGQPSRLTTAAGGPCLECIGREPLLDKRGLQRTCQEADAIRSVEEYVPCGRPAARLIDNGDSQPYWMCESCASHNLQNRNAHEYVRR